MQLGAIADDFTGATDLADTLVTSGLNTVLMLGLPDQNRLPDEAAEAEAVVIALKTRTVPAAEAVRQSLAAASCLRKANCRHLFFKYCSTFDSSVDGNIGPVADALLEAVGDDLTVFCPAFPKNGRKLFQGYLFVGPVLLSESGMQNHPLTPMTDPNLVRVLQGQTVHPVGLLEFETVRQGAKAIQAKLKEHRAAGIRHVIVDAIDEEDLAAIGTAVLGEELKLSTGGSGLGGGIAGSLSKESKTSLDSRKQTIPEVRGTAAVIAGSCSRATLKQIDHFMEAGLPFYRLEIGSLWADRNKTIGEVLDWAKARLGTRPILITTSESPSAVLQHQDRHGRESVGHLIESSLAQITQELIAAGVRRLILAGGETSSAAVEKLGLRMLRIGPTIDPGVPWTFSLGKDPIALALKSGNFGASDFFTSAFNKLTS